MQNFVKNLRSDYNMAVGYEIMCEGATPMQARYRTVKAMASGLYGAAVCACVGHKLVSDGGWAGPNSGGESVHCERCGYSWHHTYY